METKSCSKCCVTKDVSQFNKKAASRDGLRADCKECCAARYAAWLAAGGAKVRAEYAASEQGKSSGKAATKKYRLSEGGAARLAARISSEKTKIAAKKAARRYRSSEKGIARRRGTASKYYRNRRASDGPHVAKEKVRGKVRKLVRLGKIPRPAELSCRYCGQQAKHYHHPSYEPENWLVIVPVCVPCHAILHGGDFRHNSPPRSD